MNDCYVTVPIGLLSNALGLARRVADEMPPEHRGTNRERDAREVIDGIKSAISGPALRARLEAQPVGYVSPDDLHALGERGTGVIVGGQTRNRTVPLFATPPPDHSEEPRAMGEGRE